MDIPQYVFEARIAIEPVGSRITCNPPVMDTDEDFLVLLPRDSNVIDQLKDDGWELCGSEISDDLTTHPVDEQFVSMKSGDKNLILTKSLRFFERFMAATSVAKRLNLLRKEDRVVLFQAVLYGNSYDINGDVLWSLQ